MTPTASATNADPWTSATYRSAPPSTVVARIPISPCGGYALTYGAQSQRGYPTASFSRQTAARQRWSTIVSKSFCGVDRPRTTA